MDDHTMAKGLPESLLLDIRTFLQATPDLYLLLNTKFEIVEVSDAYLRATMVKREDILGEGIFEIFPDNPDDLHATGVANLRSSLNRVLQNKTADAMAVQKYDIRRPTSHGGGFEERYWSPLNTPILDANNQVIYIIHRVEDVTEYINLKKADANYEKKAADLRSHVVKMEMEIFHRAREIQETNKKLERLASFDILTGLANRKKLTDEIKESLRLAKQNNWHIAVIFLDIDHFKLINDTLGHKVGDQLLQIIAKRLVNNVHEYDIVSRMGGDEFIILLNHIDNPEKIANTANRILENIKKPIYIDNRALYVSASLGISIFPQDGEDETILLKHADIAMYRAKQLGRNGYQFCTGEMINQINKQMDLERQLRDALYENGFILHYQPQINLKTGKICGVEALLRLQKTDGTLLFPSEFLAVAEETGLIVPIGEHVLLTACTQLKSWENQKLYSNDDPITLAVNFSARQLKEPGFFEMIEKILLKTKLAPSSFELEVTETPIINNVNAVAQIFKKLNKIGVQISLDDFGIGCSSLNYLRQFPISTLKIDISLIQHIANKADAEIIKSIISMAHAKNIIVVAEGVETSEQVQFLIKNNCDKVQSYFFSQPLSADSITKLLTTNPSWDTYNI